VDGNDDESGWGWRILRGVFAILGAVVDGNDDGLIVVLFSRVVIGRFIGGEGSADGVCNGIVELEASILFMYTSKYKQPI